MDKIKILLIIPAYNESEGIVAVIDKVKKYCFNSEYNMNYLVINDGSTDDEEVVLRENKIDHVELINNLGIGGAVQTGYRYAYENNYDIAIQFDGDGQHDIESVTKLIKPIVAGEADFVVGSRFAKDSPSDFKSTGMRQFGINFLSNLIFFLTKIRIKDVTSGYRAANRIVIKQFLNRYPSKYPEPESYMFLISKNMRIKEVGVNMFERQSGKSSISLLNSATYMLTVSLSILFASMLKKEEN